MIARRARRLLMCALAGCGAVVTFASPAGAHGIGGTQPTNYETTITRVDPSVPGVHVEVVDLGNQLRLTNDTRHDVVVLGYDDEPYLRVGPRGVFENQKSPATYLNRSRVPTGPAPASADAKAAPVWRRVSDGNVATWHDHRAHWMGNDPPPEVQRAPGRHHLVDEWTVQLRAGSRLVAVHGLLEWVPPPSPWPWVALAVATAAVVIALSRTRWWRTVLIVALGLLVVCATLHAFGLWQASIAGRGTKLGESIYAIVGIALGLLALVWARRRGVEAAVPFVLVAAVFLLVATGLADVGAIGHSQEPSSLPAWLARLVVTVDIGLGVGLAVGSGLRLRVLTPPNSRAGAEPPRDEEEIARVTS